MVPPANSSTLPVGNSETNFGESPDLRKRFDLSKPKFGLFGMVSVPKSPPIPRLSIVVPIGRDLAAFERTLISVLENQPTDCEVLVCHDGSYDDPFDLCDEVRFVLADSCELVDLVAAGAVQARGRFVHFLGEGIRATCGWTDEALQKFEHFDAGAVVPVIRHAQNGKIIAAGWCDGRDRLCKSHGQRRDQIEGQPQLIGTYLQASFWRRKVIRSLSGAYAGRRSVEVAYAYEHLIREAGWRSVLADHCNLLSDSMTLPWDVTGPSRGTTLRAIRNHFCGGGASRTLTAASWAALANTMRPKYLPEALGQALAPLAARRVAQQLRSGYVTRCSRQETIVPLPKQSRHRAA